MSVLFLIQAWRLVGSASPLSLNLARAAPHSGAWAMRCCCCEFDWRETCRCGGSEPGCSCCQGRQGVPASNPHISTFKTTRLSPDTSAYDALNSFSLFKKPPSIWSEGALNGCCGKPCSPARYLHIVFDLAYNQRHLDETAGTTRTVVAMESTLSRLKPRL